MYDVTTDEQSHAQIMALPNDALGFLTEARATLEVAPWNGDPFVDDRPDGPVRTLLFGPHREGMITYLILENQRRVDLLKVIWLG